MEYPPDQFIYHACQTIYVSIIGDLPPSRRVVASFSRRDALDDLIAYLNMMMTETVLLNDATEDQIKDAYDEHLAQPVEIVECD
ncbi:hypothetical protein [Parerythrobacter lacustris]|uniref:DUF1488 family protein n=1 Tax=Parerythrobacter lacustris TaxID=2969984 RepID=A0ABT1XR43_9SPHN|nr:hypothetical protein [Parerythrobacter lacustris]MCR2834124.1 hypothetical protein [Parerythrobacter lacustris]